MGPPSLHELAPYSHSGVLALVGSSNDAIAAVCLLVRGLRDNRGAAKC